MRFSVFVAGAFATLAAAQSSTVSAASSSVSVDPAQASTIACLKTCADDDVNCKARCVGVPFPNTDQANATNTCAAACPQGSGTADDNTKWSNCVASCIGTNYWTSSGGTPQATGSGSSGSGASGVTTGTATTGGAATGTTNSTKTTSSSTGAAEVIRVGSSAVGLFGFLAAVLAI